MPFPVFLFLLLIALIGLRILWKDSSKRKNLPTKSLQKKGYPKDQDRYSVLTKRSLIPNLPHSTVLFEAGLDSLNPKELKKLEENLVYLTKYIANGQDWTLELRSSADASGNPTRNRKLVKQRALCVQDFVIRFLKQEYPNSKTNDWESKIKIVLEKPVFGKTPREREMLRSVSLHISKC